jgi:hypothetical protein
MHQKHFERAAAFPILISFAVLCMLQPRGRVFDGPTRFRTFIRASPFICLLDSFDILLRWLLTSIYLRCPPLLALKIVSHDRFRSSDPLVGFEKIRASLLLRLLYVCFIVLPALRMLSSFQFTPMAQIYAGMFIFSYVVDEIFCVSAPPNNFFTLRMTKFRSLADYADCLTHQDNAREALFRNVLRSLDVYGIALWFLVIVGQCAGFIWLCFAYDCFWDMDETGDVIRLCAKKSPLIIIAVIMGLLFSPFTNWILLRYPTVGRALYLVSPEGWSQPGEFEVDLEGKLWLVFLFVNLLSAGVGYRTFLMKVPYGYGR